MNVLIVIPARYQSTRLPGKPLVKIAGESLLSRVVKQGKRAVTLLEKAGVTAELLVATDHDEIFAHAQSLGASVIMTNPDCPSGTDRALAAVHESDRAPDVVVNFQGDSPFTPPDFISEIVKVFEKDPDIAVATPAAKLSWQELDRLRESKIKTPFSGTTVVVNPHGNALWFSKQIIPAVRKEREMREQELECPVRVHLGLYAYRMDMLETYCELPRTRYEKLEGLEQLRLLENDIAIRVVDVSFNGRPYISGIDSPEDVERAEALIKSGVFQSE